MMKLLSLKLICPLLLCILTVPGVSAQDATGIYGKYNRSVKGDPQGASYLYMLKDYHYVIVFFGGAQLGTWTLSEQGLVVFRPHMPSSRFQLYGRHNPDIKDSTRICFQQFAEEETFIGTGGEGAGQPLLQRVFNPEPNCFGYPYVYRFQGKKKNFVFANKPYRDEDSVEARQLYPFSNPDGYNDFIAVYHKPGGEYEPFVARWNGKALAFSEDDIDVPSPFEEGEDREFLDELSHANPDPDTIFFNPRYKEAPDVAQDTLNFTYHKEKGAYISTLNYREGEEYDREADDFNRMNIVYPFRKLQPGAPVKGSFTLAGGSLFHASCE